jgi:peptidoglycan/LPS O-acetylase OafA/YrhL
MGNSGGTDVDLSTDPVPPAQRSTRRWETATAVVAGVLCGGGALLLGLLFFQFVDVYFTIWTSVVIDDADIRRYAVTATSCVIALGAALLAALAARRSKLAWLAGVLLVLGIVAALLFAVPQGRWTPVEPGPEPLPSNYEPCYSGSNDCGGGG